MGSYYAMIFVWTVIGFMVFRDEFIVKWMGLKDPSNRDLFEMLTLSILCGPGSFLVVFFSFVLTIGDILFKEGE